MYRLGWRNFDHNQLFFNFLFDDRTYVAPKLDIYTSRSRGQCPRGAGMHTPFKSFPL